MVEFVTRKKPIVFEVKIIGQKSTSLVRFLNSSIFIRYDLKFEEDLYFGSLNSTTNYFGGQRWPKGQHRPKVNDLGAISKIVTFHLINLKFEEDLYFGSLNSTANYFGGQHGPKGQHRPKVIN